MPGASVFSYYVNPANGTAISATLISLVGDIVIDGKLLSPDNNPWGLEKNANGIYWVNCGGRRVVIRDSRILGTLVLRDANEVTVEGSVHWEPAVEGYPALLV